LLLALGFTFTQSKHETYQTQSTTDTMAVAATAPAEKEYKHETAADDPLNARIYTLDNGLKVYLTDYEDAPRIQTYIAVRAGSKNDPADATGLAHYLEHMVFKGTTELGTADWQKEQEELAKIEALYEKYRGTSDEAMRKKIYQQIDSVSGVAATYAIANEYDKLLTAIGAKGTNAYTWVDQTVYTNDILSNQMERWLELEAYRLSVLVGHTVQLQAKEPAGGGLAMGGDPLKDPVPVYAPVVTDGQSFRVDVVVTGSLRAPCLVVGQQKSVQERLPRQFQRRGVGDGSGEVAVQLPKQQALIVILKALEA
jgi:hypothetical protein